MVRRLALLLMLAAVPGSLTARLASAQEPETDAVAPAHVAFVDGGAILEREGRTENSPLNMPLLSGDRLRTTDGRVEVLFGDGSTLYLDARTTIDFQSDDLLRLIDGRVRVNIPGPARTVSYRIDSPAGSVRIAQPGEYRVAILHGEREIQIELAVVRGAGEVFTDQGETPVRAGERAYASAGLAPSYPYAFNSATWDDFDRWAEARRDVQLGASAQYLPSEIRTYAPVLDSYGDWRYDQPYGYVWYPRVAAGWRPYYHGRWMSYP
jgi:ferric-dicitrate binding protein FerR (iron transport regulator)